MLVKEDTWYHVYPNPRKKHHSKRVQDLTFGRYIFEPYMDDFRLDLTIKVLSYRMK